MEGLVTVIVPVYNVSKYLARCVDSLINQTYTTLQIILVDDGSPDDSGDICDAYAQQDSRIEVIHQSNGGISAARNAGLDHARGEWITFVDSDDYVSPYYVEDMYTAAVNNGCDMAISFHTKVAEADKEVADFSRVTETYGFSGRELSVQRYKEKGFEKFHVYLIYTLSWAKLYKSHLWKTLRFPIGKINEDLFVSHELLYRAERIVVIDAKLYAYMQSSGSIMRSGYSLKRLDVLDAWQEGVRFYNSVDEQALSRAAGDLYCYNIFTERYLCKKYLPHEREVQRQLHQRMKTVYREAKPFRNEITTTPFGRYIIHRVCMFIGRWCPPLYDRLIIQSKPWRRDL